MKEGKNLVIVESPAKAGTIQKFLGEGFIVKSSFGHIRDLSDNELSIDIQGEPIILLLAMATIMLIILLFG